MATNHACKRPLPEPEDPEAPRKRVRRARARRYKDRLPSAIYDILPFIHLTHHALDEFNRRVARATSRRTKPSTFDYVPADQYLSQCSSAELQDLRQSARHGGPDLRTLDQMSSASATPRRQQQQRQQPRGSRVQKSRTNSAVSVTSASPSVRSSAAQNDDNDASTATTTRSKSTTAYDGNFEKILRDAGIFDLYLQDSADTSLSAPPDDLDELIHRLEHNRRSCSPSTHTVDDFRRFKRTEHFAKNEAAIMGRVIHELLGPVEESGLTTMRDTLFTNLEPLHPQMTGDSRVARGKPDFCDGADPSSLDRAIYHELSSLIVPTKHGDCPILPNFTLVAKGPKGTMEVANRQVRHEGSLCARAMHALKTYGLANPTKQQDPGPPYRASNIICFYLPGKLKFYTVLRRYHHQRQQVQYYLHDIASFSTDSTHQEFLQAARALRNAREWATEKRNATIQQANARRAASLLTGGNNSSETNAAETNATEAFRQSIETGLTDLLDDVQETVRVGRAGTTL